MCKSNSEKGYLVYIVIVFFLNLFWEYVLLNWFWFFFVLIKRNINILVYFYYWIIFKKLIYM